MLAVGAFGMVVETEAAFQLPGVDGRQVRSLCDVLCLGAGDGDNDGGSRFSFATFIRCEPAGFLGEDETRVECGEFLPNVEEGVGCGDAVDNELSRRRVQVDRGGTRDEVEEGRGPRV